MKQVKVIQKLRSIIGRCSDIRVTLAEKHGWWLIASSVTLVMIIMGVGGYVISEHKFNESQSPKVVQAVQIKKQLVEKAVVIKQIDNKQVISEAELSVYSKMHKMINTKIIAEDGKIWGEIEITSDRCQQLITEISESQYPDKDVLLGFLTRWKSENFSSGVGEHNYLWDGLNGTIGKASDLRP